MFLDRLRNGSQAAEEVLTLSRIAAWAKSARAELHIPMSMLDVSKAFGTTDLVMAAECAERYVGTGIALRQRQRRHGHPDGLGVGD